MIHIKEQFKNFVDIKCIHYKCIYISVLDVYKI